MKTLLFFTISLLLFAGCADSITFENYVKIDRAKNIKLDIKKPILNPNQILVKSNVYKISDDWLKGLVETNKNLKKYFNTYDTSDLKLEITLLNYGYNKRFIRDDNTFEDCEKYEDNYERLHCYERNHKGYYEIEFYCNMKAVITNYGKEKIFYEEYYNTLHDKYSYPYDDYNTNFNITTIIQGTYNKIFKKIRSDLREPFSIIEIKKHKEKEQYAIQIAGGTCNYMYIGQPVRLYSTKGEFIGTGEISKNSSCTFAWIKTNAVLRKPMLDDKVLILFTD